ncbi:MAG: hypothetical protein F9B45_22115 [Phycisphaera sp. RhM]|nr:hypothetical protein [Phycisphaera sp. RhM]
MPNRPRPRAYFFRNGVELSGHEMNGRPVVNCGVPTGKIGNAACLQSIVVRDTRDVELSERDFGGPVSVKVWSPESEAIWFGIAEVETVKQVNAERKAFVPR